MFSRALLNGPVSNNRQPRNAIVYSLLGLVCVQAVFLLPYVTLIPSERTNLFTASLTLIPLFGACVAMGARFLSYFNKREFLIWGGLGLCMGASAFLNSPPADSIYRVYAFWIPSIAGLVCGRLLFRSGKVRFYAAMTATVLLWLFSVSHLVLGASPSYLGLHTHAIANVVILLSAGPILLMYEKSAWAVALGGGALLSGFGVCFFAGSRFVILLPIVILLVVGFIKPSMRKIVAGGVVLFVGIASLYFWAFPGEIPRLHRYESVFYRVESYPAAAELIAKEPVWGIGLRTPRDVMLTDYEMRTTLASKKQFMTVVKRNVTYDNMILTMLVGCGIPATLLLIAMFVYYAIHLQKWLKRCDNPALTVAISLPLLSSCIHFLVHDGLLYPQVCWFFFILVGVIPIMYGNSESSELSNTSL